MSYFNCSNEIRVSITIVFNKKDLILYNNMTMRYIDWLKHVLKTIKMCFYSYRVFHRLSNLESKTLQQLGGKKVVKIVLHEWYKIVFLYWIKEKDKKCDNSKCACVLIRRCAIALFRRAWNSRGFFSSHCVPIARVRDPKSLSISVCVYIIILYPGVCRRQNPIIRHARQLTK